MERERALLRELIRKIKDMYIILQLYPPETALPKIETILEDEAHVIVQWERSTKAGEGADHA